MALYHAEIVVMVHVQNRTTVRSLIINPFARTDIHYCIKEDLALHTSRAPKIYKYCTLDSRQENLK